MIRKRFSLLQTIIEDITFGLVRMYVTPYRFSWNHKLRKAFSKFYRRYYELISKFNVGLKSLLHQGLSEPEFYSDLVYKFKKIRDMTDFSDQFRKKYNALQTYWL